MAKILVADDNSNIQKMVGLALKDQGIDVVAVGNGEAAVRKISDLHPDLVLADVFMPVRNGYEVCRYVKEDSSLAHIPVILLVGAFDPLDEQEAQRSGADGVLKKPFVPPDPLISMVKSALTRAGVALGPTEEGEKAGAPRKRSTSEIFNAGMSAKLAELSPQAIPEATPEPVEEFPMAPGHLKIQEGQEPLAFGSLLETPEVQEDPAVTSKPMIDIGEFQKWDEEKLEVEEEKEEEVEEAPHGGWQPSGLQEQIERADTPSSAVPDWRDEAFHGSSPAQSTPPTHGTPSVEQPAVVEAVELPCVAVAAVAKKPAEMPAPFSGDAWASTLAADVEKKVSEVKEIPTGAAEAEPSKQAGDHLTAELPETAALESATVEAAAATKEAKPAEPANWAAVPETAWEAEAKKASQLASTWGAPQAFSADETQDVPVYEAENSEVALETPAGEAASAYSGEEAPRTEAWVNEPPAIKVPTDALEEDWTVAAPVPTAPVVEETPAESLQAEVAPVEEHEAQPADAEEAPTPEPAPANMDELVARVLQKMSPDVLQKVTREILKPVIEAIIQDEINAKKL